MPTVTFTVVMMNKKEQSPKPIRAEELRQVSEEISRAYPVESRVPDFSEVVLLEIDPYRIHAYWHVTPGDLQTARRTHSLPNAPLVLRLYDISEGSFEERPEAPDESMAISGLSGETYYEGLAEGHVYVADLALLREDGSMVRLTHSNPVHLPPSGESEVYELVVVDISQEESGVPAPSEVATDVTAPLPTAPVDFRRDVSSRRERPST